jgi:SAM-dependent methyltransferase
LLAQPFVTVLAAPPHMRGPMLPILPDSCFPGYRTGASGAPEYSVEEYIYPENTYDLVVSNLVLHYIENLANVYQKVYCTLKVGGYFLFNIEHPTFTAGVNEDWIYDENGKPDMM